MKKNLTALLFLKKVILGVALCVVVATGVKAQISNNWCFGTAGYGWDFRTEPPSFFKTVMHAPGGTQAASDSLGNLLFYTDGDTIWTKNHQKMKGSYGSFNSWYSGYSKSHSPSAVLPVPGKPQRYYVFSAGFSAGSYISGLDIIPLGYRELDLSRNGGLGEVLDSSRRLLTTYNTYQLATIRHSNKKDFWLLARALDTILVYSVTNAGINLAFKTYFEDLSKNLVTSGFWTSGVSGGFKAANNGKLLALFFNYTDSSQATLVNNSFLYLLPFDPSSGVLGNATMVDSCHTIWNDTSYRSFRDVAFAPGDSLFYVTTNAVTGGGDPGSIGGINQYHLDSQGVFKKIFIINFFPNSSSYSTLQLAPNGKIYLAGGVSKGIGLGIIEKPDVPGMGCKVKPNTIPLPFYLYTFRKGDPWTDFTLITSLPSSHNDFMRVKFLGMPNRYCDGVTHFYNLSDTGCFSKYRWYINGDSTDAVNTQYTFTQPGVYFVKLRATTPAGYHVWYSDSMEIKPEHFPPKAGFYTQTQTGCQWVSFILSDTSKSLTNKTGTAYKKWDFGDGQIMNDSLVNSTVARHTYTKSGNYTLKLTYFNGYCTDSFLLQQQVTILEAPKPGFYFSPDKGCSPLKTIIKPRTEGKVDSFYYSFDNGVSWFNADNGMLEKTFTGEGASDVIQKLKGPTGCVTTDTQQIRVTPGLPANYKQEIYAATFNENNHIVLKWNSVKNAHSYKVLYARDGVSFTDKFILRDTLVIDSTGSALNENYYRMAAVDSCGNNSTMGNLVKPVLMVATAESNEKAVVRFSAYEQTDRMVKSYTIQRSREGNGFQNVCTWTPSEVYYDNSFFELGGKACCYRIKVDFEPQQEGFSLSNEVCLDYQPVLWIPDAFSPNEDGINDEFFIVYAGIVKFELTIYNAWGEKIFQTTDPSFRWKGEKVPSGVYSYVLSAKCTNQRINTSGTITIVR
ncbi:MAG: gliding motility-associated C-terminal domain-containing protein [Bacteroidia bacterium]|nr:gliding motility-associated C-terminal domain-containing protein [Bacteroidia bacterium]